MCRSRARMGRLLGMFVIVLPRESPSWQSGVADVAVGPFDSREAADRYLAVRDADEFTGQLRERVGKVVEVLEPRPAT